MFIIIMIHVSSLDPFRKREKTHFENRIINLYKGFSSFKDYFWKKKLLVSGLKWLWTSSMSINKLSNINQESFQDVSSKMFTFTCFEVKGAYKGELHYTETVLCDRNGVLPHFQMWVAIIGFDDPCYSFPNL